MKLGSKRLKIKILHILSIGWRRQENCVLLTMGSFEPRKLFGYFCSGHQKGELIPRLLEAIDGALTKIVLLTVQSRRA